MTDVDKLLVRIGTLFDAIAHGDEKHRQWLREAIVDHFAGRQVLHEGEIRDDTRLSNKACRHVYGSLQPGVKRKGIAGNCNCPKGRCWYGEQNQRRADGLHALTPERWERSG